MERFPRLRHPDRRPPRCRSKGEGPEGDPTPRYPCLCPGATSQASGRARSFKGALKKSKFRRSVEGDPGECTGRGGAEARTQKAEGDSGPLVPWRTRPPRGWPCSLPGSACPVPAPDRRSLAVLPSQASRLLSSC